MTSRHRLYWACQLLGWGAYSIIGAIAAAQQMGWRASLVAGYGCYWLYSMALTDALRRELHRRHWRRLSPGRQWLRLIAGATVIGVVQAALIVAVNLAFEGRQSPFVTHGIEVLFVWIGTTAATLMWVLYYVWFTAARRRQERQAEMQLSLREAELRALEAQINPHFLFNGLNSIRGLVIEDPARAQDMITRLASLLRHNLRHDAAHTVPFASEVDAVKDYLALEGARFDERLRVQFAIDARALEIPVPSMLLQTLVENAVKHGIARLPAGGDLVIRATVDGEALTVEVENTGQLGDAAPDGTQVGLANTRERLRILYGDRARLDLTSRAGPRVAATVLIPIAV